MIIKMRRDEVTDSDEIHPESQILTKMKHPNVISILASGIKPDPFIVLEHLQKGTLAELLYNTRNSTPGGRLQLKTSLSFARQIIAALQYLHQDNSSSVAVVHAGLYCTVYLASYLFHYLNSFVLNVLYIPPIVQICGLKISVLRITTN